ncbi:hypothetical protein RUM44_009748 [Polyplax serrata]|uniref:BTB domain-containing protein n=1 Tax=Polyplax serrata TaxID=468196 RepID=A0ABR1ATK3_POLSC
MVVLDVFQYLFLLCRYLTDVSANLPVERDVCQLDVILWNYLMASKVLSRKCGTNLKIGTSQEDKIAKQAQLNLERDILRLFENSIYCDIKLTVNTSYITTHSCILQTRAGKFYRYIYAEFEALTQNGISVFCFCNASFSCLQTFIQNIYSNIHTSKAEDNIIKHLQESKTISIDQSTTEKLKLSCDNTKASPELDLFFTPKCSPTELQKTFCESSDLKIKDNNVVSYYKIVSVDDIPLDDKLEKGDTNPIILNTENRGEEFLEQELEEQDKLLLSFQTILSKNNKTKQNSLNHSNSSHVTKKIKPKANSKIESKIILKEVNDKTKNKIPLWKSKTTNESTFTYDKRLVPNRNSKKQIPLTNCKNIQKSFIRNHRVENIFCTSDMDVSTTECDSGLENSSLCQVETSPREHTVSDTSGVGLTDSNFNNGNPNDETLSVNKSGSTETSMSSDVVTWDGHEDQKAKFLVQVEDRPVEISPVCHGQMDSYADDMGNDEFPMNEDDLKLLDEMDRNIKNCEDFLSMERNHSTNWDTQFYSNHHCNNYGESYLEDKYCDTTEDNSGCCNNEVLMLNRNGSMHLSGHHREEDGGENNLSNVNYEQINWGEVRDSGNENMNSLDNNDSMENIDSNERQHNSSLNVCIYSDNEGNVNVKHCDIQETKTPPCTPKKVKIENEEAERNDSLNFPDNTSNKLENNSTSGVSNYFIDASSLLDEDELISVPSLINFKPVAPNGFDEVEGGNEEESLTSKTVTSNFYYLGSDSEDQASLNIQENERKQGDIIFKNSIPHYSKHEVTENPIVSREEQVSDDCNFNKQVCNMENEFTIPSTNSEASDVHSRESDLQCKTDQIYSNDTVLCEPKFLIGIKSKLSEIVRSPTTAELELCAGDVRSDSNLSSVEDCYNSSNEEVTRPRNIDKKEKDERNLSRCHGEAWVVSFGDDKKSKNKSDKLTNSDLRPKSDGNKESEEKRTPLTVRRHHEVTSSDSSGNFSLNDTTDGKTNDDVNEEQRGFPVEKSSSLGYFLDFGKQNERAPAAGIPDTQEKEKKNIFSMFIGIDDNTKSLTRKKPKYIIDKERALEKNREETPCDTSMASEVGECQDETKKPFYIYIESDSPNVKRKQFQRKPVKSSVESKENSKSYLRSLSYTVKKPRGSSERPVGEANNECECSSSDTSLLIIDNDFTSSKRSSGDKLPVSFDKSGTSEAEAKMTAWSETKIQNDEDSLSECWLNTKDILVNYTGNPDIQNNLGLKKDSTFIKTENKSKHKEQSYQGKPSDRDSGVGLVHKERENFVKLSDMYQSDSQQKVKDRTGRMSQSITENSSSRKTTGNSLSKSIEADSDTLAGFQINRSLSRLFPNLSSHSLASLSRRDGSRVEKNDNQASEHSEVSTSLQSSLEPSALEISTSETDVSSHGGTSSRLGEDLLRMFLEEIGPDVTVEVAGRRIKAHKCILSSRCQYFAAILSGGWVESAGNVISLQGKRLGKHRSKLVPFNFDPECYEATVERDILSDTKTKFVPTKNMCGWSKDKTSRLIYQPAAFQKVYAQLLDRRKKRRLRRLKTNYLRSFLEGGTKRKQRESDENETGSRKSSVKSKNREGKSKFRKRKDSWYLNSKCKTPEFPRTYRQMDDDVDHEKQPLGEGEEGEQINMGPNYESWLLMRNPNSGEREVFHAFWKGEGNLKSIRKAQTKMMLSFMDPSVDPCQDFYQFACGNWGHKNPIPKDKAGYDTFEMLRESLDIVLQDLLMEEDNDTMNEATIKTKNLYRSCMNNKILEERREKPLLVLLESLGGWPMIDPNWSGENFDWIVLMAKLRLYNNDILISEWVGPDIKNSDEYVIQFDQTSLGLPTREYFLEPCNYVYLEAYKNYLIKISTLLGSTPENAKSEAEDLMVFETALAEITSSPDERRNVSELYERMTVSELSETVPEINWVKYLTIVLNRDVDPQEPVVMFALRYVQDLVKLLCQTEPRVISNYLLWRFIRHRVNNLDDRFQEAKQHFYYILFGREEAPPRWKNCVAQVNTNMGMGLGAMFVARYFDEKSKNDTLEMTHDIMKSFRQILNHTVWIDNETKRLAIQKVDAMMLRIGYPDFILNRDALNERYAEVNIDPELYFENTLNILKHLTRAEQDRLGTRVNKAMWNTPPAVVNAYYSRNKNQIMFPAGILQPPFYHRYFPRSLNYGGIGVVIGHEITHGFDDKGRLFDQDGNLHKWWKEPAIEAFHERAQCLIDQYSKYTVTEVGMQIDGVNTQGENIADNGGIKQAFKAYESWLSVHGDKDEVLQGINATNLQLFFLNFAQIWCGTMRPEATRNKLKTAVHSPGKFRVIGTLSNSEDFARVFQFSYNTVHFALRYIYSGESRIPESLNIVELATLADMLCLDGLQEIISYNLKVKYCHSFHVPCSICSVGVIDCLPIAAAYGLDELYRKCLRWITKYFVKLWPTKSFGSLPKELHEKCFQHFVVHLTVDNVLDTVANIDKVRGSLTNVRWAESVSRLVRKLNEAVVRYIADHFSGVLTSDK